MHRTHTFYAGCMTDWRAPRAAAGVREHWSLLAAAQPEDPADSVASASSTAALPVPARRWLEHAVAPNTRPFRKVLLRMHGEIRIGSWHRMTATQIIVPSEGFIWAATTSVAGLPVRGFDRYRSPRHGKMSWRLLGRLPIVHDDSEDIARSAAGRLAAESIFVPTAFASADWTEATADSVVMRRQIDGYTDDVTLRVGGDGSLLALTMKRWGRPPGRAIGEHDFCARILQEDTFSGITIPSRVAVGWPTESDDGDFFRATITAAEFR